MTTTERTDTPAVSLDEADAAFTRATRKTHRAGRAFRNARTRESLTALKALTLYIGDVYKPEKGFELARYDGTRTCVVTLIDDTSAPDDPRLDHYANRIDPFALLDTPYPRLDQDRWRIDA